MRFVSTSAGYINVDRIVSFEERGGPGDGNIPFRTDIHYLNENNEGCTARLISNNLTKEFQLIENKLFAATPGFFVLWTESDYTTEDQFFLIKMPVVAWSSNGEWADPISPNPDTPGETHLLCPDGRILSMEIEYDSVNDFLAAMREKEPQRRKEAEKGMQRAKETSRLEVQRLREIHSRMGE